MLCYDASVGSGEGSLNLPNQILGITIDSRYFFNRWYILENKYVCATNKQCRFIKNSSTENAEVDFVENTVEALDESLKCIAVFFDLAKAFDTVSHETLLDKLNNYSVRGMRGVTARWHY